MSAPFDTLKLARRFEAAGIEHKQAGDMAAAIAEATVSADLATKADLRDLDQRLTIKVGGMLILAVGVLLAGLGTGVTIILNRLPAAPAVPSQHAGFVLAADERSFDWDRYHARQDACIEKDRIAAQCEVERNPLFNSFVRRGVPEGYCDELALRQAQRACSAFTGERR